MAQSVSFSETDLSFISDIADSTGRLINEAMIAKFGTRGVKAAMAGVFAAAFLTYGSCDDETPAAVADGVHSFNLILTLAMVPFTLVQTQ